MLNSFRIQVEDDNVQALRRAMSAFNKYAALGMASFNNTQVCNTCNPQSSYKTFSG
jgi:hypothetical protein